MYMIPYQRFIGILIIGMLLVPAILAAENKVPRDGTIYVGEANLDISDCAVRNGDEIAWWMSGNPEGTPTARARVDDVRQFTVDPETFRGHAGTWFTLIGKKSVFTVEEPFFMAELIENGIDHVPEAIKRGNLVSFKISTNLAGISQRPGSPGAIVSLNLTGPNETVYNTLSSSRTNDFNLDTVYVYTSPYDTGVVWDTTDEKKFPDGEYTISAITNVNQIYDNNPELGATYTEKITYTLGKTEVKPTPTETEKPDTKNSDSEDSEASENDNEDDEKSDSGSDKEDNVKDEDNTSDQTKEKENDEVKKEDENDTHDNTSSEQITFEAEETPEVTETPEIIQTLQPTPEETPEPTPEITMRPSRTPYPRPPAPGAGGASQTTAASPLSSFSIITALTTGAVLLIVQRRR
jgi:hypothetical protein